MGMQARFCPSFQTNPNWAQDVPVDRGIVSCNNLSATVNCENTDSASSSSCLQLIGGGEERREPGKYSLDTPGLMVLEDLGLELRHPR
jgi:hypothetical protein